MSLIGLNGTFLAVIQVSQAVISKPRPTNYKLPRWPDSLGQWSLTLFKVLNKFPCIHLL